MSQKVELPLDTKCYLCDSYYSQVHLIFIVYKCFLCMKLTPYCISCELKLQRLFGKGNFFKCMICNKLTNALDKIEVSPCSINNNINAVNNPFYKTPSKPFMENNIPISTIRKNSNSNYLLNINKDEEEKKDTANTNKLMISNFLNDFNKININFAPNKKQNNDIASSSFISTNKNYLNNTINSVSVSPFKKDGHDFSLLANRNRLNKRLCLNDTLLGRKRDDSENDNKLKRSNRSRGKFKNLISMKMSKVYQKENNEDREINSNNDCVNNGIGLNFLNERNKNNDSIMNNPFLNYQKGMNYSFIDGKSTPHRISNNSFEYF